MTMKRKAFVLLSGGIDSTTCLALACEDSSQTVEAISVNYGQRHSKEIECAQRVCERYGVEHHTIDLRGVMGGKGTMLTDRSVDIPSISYEDIKGVSPTYVPFRNGTMLAALSSHAQKYTAEQIHQAVEDQLHGLNNDGTTKAFWTEYFTQQAKDLATVYIGVHAEDGRNWAYPDCTPEFVGAMANAIYVGTYFTVRLSAPFVNASKADIIKRGDELGVPYNLTWSCYAGDEYHCGECPTCRARKEAFIVAGVTDPTDYASDHVKYDHDSDEIPF